MDDKKETEKDDKAAVETPKLNEKPLSMLEESKKVFKDNSELLEKIKEEKTALERLASELALGGQTSGGIPPKEVVEPTPEEYAKLVLEGKVGTPKAE